MEKLLYIYICEQNMCTEIWTWLYKPKKTKKDIYSVANMDYLEWRINRKRCWKDGKPKIKKKNHQEKKLYDTIHSGIYVRWSLNKLILFKK